jgi:hypothetical protein
MLGEHRQDLKRLFLKANAQAVLAQFARTKIQFEDPESEPPANPMVFPHSELNLNEAECITGQILADLEPGRDPCKAFGERQLPGDPQSRRKELAVHRGGVEIESQ